MRSLLLAALGIAAFSATMAVETPEANAVVYCAAGVYRAGCGRATRRNRPRSCPAYDPTCYSAIRHDA
jgi:hypothetical protein